MLWLCTLHFKKCSTEREIIIFQRKFMLFNERLSVPIFSQSVHAQPMPCAYPNLTPTLLREPRVTVLLCFLPTVITLGNIMQRYYRNTKTLMQNDKAQTNYNPSRKITLGCCATWGRDISDVHRNETSIAEFVALDISANHNNNTREL